MDFGGTPEAKTGSSSPLSTISIYPFPYPYLHDAAMPEAHVISSPQPEAGSASDALATSSSRAPGTPVGKLLNNPFLKRPRIKCSDADSTFSPLLPKEG